MANSTGVLGSGVRYLRRADPDDDILGTLPGLPSLSLQGASSENGAMRSAGDRPQSRGGTEEIQSFFVAIGKLATWDLQTWCGGG